MACAQVPLTQPELTRFLARDEAFAGKSSIDTAAMRALDGSSCRAVTPDGVVGAGSECVDLGIEMTYHGLENPLFFLPPASQPHQSATREQVHAARAAGVASSFRSAAAAPRPPAHSTSAAPRRGVHILRARGAQVGFGSIIEYSMMFLARSTTRGAQLQLGAQSSRGWTSPWFCGEERSLTCYFNISSCCAVVTLNGRALELPRHGATR